MQPDSEKQDYTKQNNNFSSESAYPSYQTVPPPYSAYPGQPIGGTGYAVTGTPYISQPPLHQQKRIVIVPVRRRVMIYRVVTPITSSLRVFLLLSGFIYALWGITTFSFQIVLAVNSYSSYYHGFWIGSFLIIGGIIMMVAGLRSAYPLGHLSRMYVIDLIFCIIGLAFSIANYTMSNRCVSPSVWYCDDSLESNLKLGLLVIFGVAFIHTIFNMFFISKEQRRTISTSNPNVLPY